MRLPGFWSTPPGEIPSPVIRVVVPSPAGDRHQEVEFLIDTGAEHTVLSAAVVRTLGLPAVPAGVRLEGVGGAAEAVQVTAALILARDDGSLFRVNTACFAFATENPLDASILGRDVLNLFSVVVDYPNKTVCLLTGRHRYVIHEG